MDWITTSVLPRMGFPEIDDAHLKLADLVNRLANAMENNEVKSHCDGLLTEFIEQTTLHFTLEEQLMADKQYPHAEAHHAIHARLIDDVLTFKASYDAGTNPQSATLLSILNSWLTRDIFGADKQLAAFLQAPA